MINQVKILLVENLFLYFKIVVVLDDETASLQILANQLDFSSGRLRPRAGTKPIGQLPVRTKVKCDICNKIYRVAYMQVSFLYNTISLVHVICFD
jgi:hypothetical protein